MATEDRENYPKNNVLSAVSTLLYLSQAAGQYTQSSCAMQHTVITAGVS